MNTTIQGLKTFYINTGDTSKEKLLVLHGWGADVGTMLPVINILKEYYDVIAFDFPAHGGTDFLKATGRLKIMRLLQLNLFLRSI